MDRESTEHLQGKESIILAILLQLSPTSDVWVGIWQTLCLTGSLSQEMVKLCKGN